MSGEPRADQSADALHALCLADPVWAERYEGWTELGSGASATVVRTHSRASGEDVALKVFLRVAPDDWQRFQAEVRNAQALASPFIVRTYSPFQRGAVAWIEMELVDGRNLRHELERRLAGHGSFSLNETLGVGAAAARALVAAHEAGVVHRDVKPANVLLPRSGRPAAKLGDFGTSRLAGAARITHTGLLAGTPQFVSPEVVAGSRAGPASDVYGLMLCVYLMLSGNRFPFPVAEDGPVTQWLKAHAEVPALPVTAFNPDMPRWLEELVSRGLDKDPSRRPSAADVAAAFAGTSSPATPAAPRRSKLQAGAGLAGVAVVSLVGAGLLRRGDDEPASTRAIPQTAAPTGSVPLLEGSVSPSVRRETSAPPAPKEESRAPARTQAPPTVARPEPTIAAAPGITLRAALRGDLLTLVNLGPGRLEALRIVVIDAEGGRHDAAAEAIVPGEELSLSLDEFEPPLDAAQPPARLEVTARDERGGGHTFPLPLR